MARLNFATSFYYSHEQSDIDAHGYVNIRVCRRMPTRHVLPYQRGYAVLLVLL